MSINGILLLNKARGVSSNKVVNKVKYLLKAEKAGHLGTLDVLGEGLLPITLGKGTRLFEYYLNKDKVYLTTFKFGQTTDTLDLEGEITMKNDVKVSFQDVENASKHFVGRFAQMPPIYSAKKINGQKAYDLARAGQNVELKPKEIEIYSINVLKEVEDNTFLLEVHCSSGTYIRSLCRDIAEKLSTYGVMLDIQRTRCGDFDIRNSYTLEDIEKGIFNIVDLASLFDYQTLQIDKRLEEKLLNGVLLPVNLLPTSNINLTEEIKIVGENGFIGIGNIVDDKLKLTLRLI